MENLCMNRKAYGEFGYRKLCAVRRPIRFR